jgi:hypothetical protein
MVMQEIRDKEEGFRGGQYARTEEELYGKAIALLEKCKIATQPSDQQLLQTTAEIPPISA